MPGGCGDIFSQVEYRATPTSLRGQIFAVPTMTVLIHEMSVTVISAVKNWTIPLADFSVLPKQGIFKIALDKHPGLKGWLTDFAQRKAGERRVWEDVCPGPEHV